MLYFNLSVHQCQLDKWGLPQRHLSQLFNHWGVKQSQVWFEHMSLKDMLEMTPVSFTWDPIVSCSRCPYVSWRKRPPVGEIFMGQEVLEETSSSGGLQMRCACWIQQMRHSVHMPAHKGGCETLRQKKMSRVECSEETRRCSEEWICLTCLSSASES